MADAETFISGEAPKKGRARSLLMAQARSAQPQDTLEDYADEDTRQGQSTARVSRSGYGRLPVYKLTPTGCTRVYVNVQSLHEVLMNPSYAAECFDCGQGDCRTDLDINACPGREPRQYRVCPVASCQKRVYDPKPTGKFKVDEFDHSSRDHSEDPNAITDEEYTQSTPASRTKSAMDLHIIGFHPATAMEMGIGRPSELPRLAVVN